MAQGDRYKNTRKPTSKTTLGKVAELFGLKEGLSKNQIKTKVATMSQKVVTQALKRAALGGAGLTLAATEVVPAALKASIKEDLKSTTKGTTQGRNKPRTAKKTRGKGAGKPAGKGGGSAPMTSSLRPRARPMTSSLRPRARPVGAKGSK